MRALQFCFRLTLHMLKFVNDFGRYFVALHLYVGSLKVAKT